MVRVTVVGALGTIILVTVEVSVRVVCSGYCQLIAIDKERELTIEAETTIVDVEVVVITAHSSYACH